MEGRNGVQLEQKTWKLQAEPSFEDVMVQACSFVNDNLDTTIST
jgi:hypothetical protein